MPTKPTARRPSPRDALAQQIQTAAAVRAAQQLELDDGELGAAAFHQSDDLCAGMRHRHHFDVLDRLQRPPHALQHEAVVIRDQHALRDASVYRWPYASTLASWSGQPILWGSQGVAAIRRSRTNCP